MGWSACARWHLRSMDRLCEVAMTCHCHPRLMNAQRTSFGLSPKPLKYLGITARKIPNCKITLTASSEFAPQFVLRALGCPIIQKDAESDTATPRFVRTLLIYSSLWRSDPIAKSCEKVGAAREALGLVKTFPWDQRHRLFDLSLRLRAYVDLVYGHVRWSFLLT